MPLRVRPAAAALGLLLGAACGDADARARAADATAADASRPTAPADSAREALLARADIGRIRGDSGAAVWLVVVSDFQCPYCKVWHDETAPRLERDYVRTGRIRIAYLNFPISTHRNAWPAHEAAMCAAEQGRFWPVADAIFATQGAWKSRPDARAYFDSLTRTLPLDQGRQQRCLAEGHLRTLIQADFDRSLRAGVGSTPSFFIGSRMIIGAQPYEAFQQALDAALAAAGARKPAG